jgi:hypothetical protein
MAGVKTCSKAVYAVKKCAMRTGAPCEREKEKGKVDVE